MTRPLTEQELRAKIADLMGLETSPVSGDEYQLLEYDDANNVIGESDWRNEVSEIFDLIESEKRAYAADEVKRVKNQLNQVLFFDTTAPTGNFIKECLLSDLDVIETEQRGRDL